MPVFVPDRLVFFGWTPTRASWKHGEQLLRWLRGMTPHAAIRRNRFSFWIWNLYNCVPALFYHTQSPHKTVRNEVKHKSKSSWTHSNPGTWKLVLILKWKTDWLVANISPTRTQLKSGTVCTVLLGTQFYAFQIQNEKRGKDLLA